MRPAIAVRVESGILVRRRCDRIVVVVVALAVRLHRRPIAVLLRLLQGYRVSFCPAAKMVRLLVLSVCLTSTYAHYNLMWPTGRILNPTGVSGPTASVFPSLMDGAGGCQNFACLWFNHGCQPGCRSCTDRAGAPVIGGTPDACSEKNGTMAPSVTDPALRTYGDVDGRDWSRANPWRSPGYSPVFSSCGMAGGGNTPGDWVSESLTEHIRSGAVTPPFVRRGFVGEHLPGGPTTTWTRGGTAEVAWSMFLNKGGGYAYRLCPANENATEECFNRHHLKFASNVSYIQMGQRSDNRTTFKATRVSTGTFPAGSEWTKNPVPPCASRDGSPAKAFDDCESPQFPPPVDGLWGDGPGACITWGEHGPVEGYQNLYDSFGNEVYKAPCSREHALDVAKQFQFNVFDEVVVPDVSPGAYVLSWRLDAEQAPQVWTQCADILIKDKAR